MHIEYYVIKLFTTRVRNSIPWLVEDSNSNTRQHIDFMQVDNITTGDVKRILPSNKAQ